MAPAPVTTDPPATVTPDAPPEQPHAPLGSVAASGFAWNVAVSTVGKILGFLAQLVLARLLVPEDFGAYAQASIVMVSAALLRDSALPQVLLHRQQNLGEWMNAGFWMSLALGTASGLIMAVAGIGFYLHTGDTSVAGLLWVAGAASPLIAVGVVPGVVLQAALRFRLIALIAAVQVAGTAVLSVLLARLHFGAYSLLLAPVLFAIARSAIYWWHSHPSIRPQLELQKWRHLAHDGSMMVLISFGGVIVGLGDYLILSTRFDKKVVGYYFFAFGLSLQTVTLLTANLAGVLLPTLARLNQERQRQVAAYLRACRALAAVGTPICVVQLVLARPLVVSVFGARWEPCVPLLQILSAGMMFALVSSFCGLVFQAQGRFRFLAAWTGVSTAVFLLMLVVGTGLAGAVGTAAAVALYHLILGSIGMRFAIERSGTWSDIARVFFPAIASAGAAALPLLTVRPLWPDVYAGHAPLWLTGGVLGAYGVLYLALYAVLLRILARDLYDQFMDRLRPMTARLFPGRGRPAGVA